MKYFIVLNSISNVDHRAMFDSYFAQPRKTYDRETILTAFHSQSIANVFSDEDQALHYARSLSRNGIPPKTSGRIAPIIECELELSNADRQIQKFCLAPDGDSSVTKTNMVGMPIMYFEVPVSQINDNAFTRAFFDKESIPSVNLKSGLTCTIC